MDFQTINKLSGSIPENSRYFDLYSSSEAASNNTEEVNRFAICYKDLSFGWHFIKSYADAKIDLPSCVINEHTLVRAYNFERYGNRDLKLAQAIAIETALPASVRSTINSLFFSDNITFEEIAKITNFDPEVIRLYEELFYNIMDRREEALFIAGIVYPETRAEEFHSTYLQDVSESTLLQRVSYNSGTESALALAGFKQNFIDYGDVANNTNKLESAIMSNAYFMAVCGFLNSSQAQGINNAKNIMAAAKHGGGDESGFQEVGVGAAPMGTIIINELQESQQQEIRQRLERTKAIQEAEVQKIRSLDDA